VRAATRVLLAAGLALAGACGEEPAPVAPTTPASTADASGDAAGIPPDPDAGALPAVAPPPAAGRLPAPPTVVLVTIDTLRREHLGCYGYFRDTSPHIDALAHEGLVFDRALAPMASTLPSHLTMLTGLYPHQHGMNSNRRGASTSFVSELGRLSAAEVFARAGYRTAGFVSAAPLAPTTGVGAGFETFEGPHNSPQGSMLRAGERNRAVLEWLEREGPRPGPFFLWVHYFDPHEPNDPEPPYDGMFRTDPAQLEWIGHRHIDPALLTEKFGHSNRIHRHFLGLTQAEQRRAQKRGAEITLDRIADLMDRYDGEVRCADDGFGALIDALRRLGRYDDALIVVVGDHGQSLGENAWIGHGTITNVNTFVPLVLRLPGNLIAPGRIDSIVSLADLMPTILARFELPESELFLGQFEGQDALSGAFARDTALVARTADPIQDGETGRQFALLAGHWKYIHRPEGTDELYDLGGAGEFVDVLGEHAALGARLRAMTEGILERKPALLEEEGGGEADKELLRSLEDLGYGGGGEDEE